MSKRPHSPDVSGKQRKRVRLLDARTISVQSPSTSNLPTSIDVEQFTISRSFEISALQTAIASSSAASTTRAFQSVPRHLRRRAASHDVRRLPQRLRERARIEMDTAKPKKGKLPKAGKSRQLTRTENFAKRQRDKAWLETHLYHAKRFHMSTLYGYRLPITPTQKSYRPSLRAARSGSIVHDYSYWSTLELRGREDVLRKVLERVVAPVGVGGGGPGAKECREGARVWEGAAYECGMWPRGAIGPVWVLWRPLTGNDPERQLWIRVHPACFAQFLGSLQCACGQVLDERRTLAFPSATPVIPGAPLPLLNTAVPASFPPTTTQSASTTGSTAPISQPPQPTHGHPATHTHPVDEIQITDLRTQLLAFNILGPKSTALLAGVLQLVKGQNQNKEVWDTIGQLGGAGVPRGMCLALEAWDPRLSYPPKLAHANPTTSNHAATRTPLPSPSLAQSQLWEPSARQPPAASKRELDARRSFDLVPGRKLRPGTGDAKVPVLLVQRSVASRLASPSHAQGQEESLHGWTILLPQGWGMPFLLSLVAPTTPLAGQREIQAQAFELSNPFFPKDWVGTHAGVKEWRGWEEEEKKGWERRPRGKRVGEEGWWSADWRRVLRSSGAGGDVQGEQGIQGEAGMGETIVTQREDADMEVEADPATTLAQETAETEVLAPWVLRLPSLSTLVQSLVRCPPGPGAGLVLHSHLSALRSQRGLPDSLPSGDLLLQSALVHVRLVPCGRGCPAELTPIYRLSPAEAALWRTALSRSASDRLQETNELIRLGATPPLQKDLIGYVTSGGFSLYRGSAHGLASVALSKLIQVGREEVAVGEAFRWLVKFSHRTGGICWPATLELVI
ncbi:POP1-domain-containing protein [Dacryopinax primogenitus]|uniref:POP1-domain-containing protein n=1 Tax=Dacryopinax primogenitus (strain DJM 731) TaxID=1858805 RepID=M5FYS6_DACPD|nr:POP1-domain-containing protein [Dacryopinax primogenitus]EJT98701.1 POP1-domain-containing protein [Dacryopinax primogenitus]